MEVLFDYVDVFVTWWRGNAYPTQSLAAILQLVVVAVAGVLVLIAWLRILQSRGFSLLVPILSTGVVLGVFLGVMHLQRSFSGEPDMRCPYYEAGQLQFELLTSPLFIKPVSGDPREDTLIVLTVRAESRWNDKVHFCGLFERSGYSKALLKSLSEIPPTDEDSEGISISFTFGNGFEKPNVTWNEYTVPPEKGPPDVAPELGDDA